MSARRGFTIVELLIVVVIIAILAALVIVTYNGAKLRAQASGIAADLKSIEKALILYKTTAGLSAWPNDNDATYFTGSANPSITSIIAAQPAFRALMSTAPVATGMSASGSYSYDNDLDTYDGCSDQPRGVNIYVGSATNVALIQAVDNIMDDGNISCGRLRYTSTSSFSYSIALNQNG